MKKTVSLATIAMFFVAVNNANAATCTWNGTKLTITGSGNETFTGCSDGSNHRNATEVTFSSGITSVGNNAFSNATSLQNVSLGGVTSVGNSAFYGAKSLTNVDMPNVTNIGSSAFYYATSLTSVDMPKVQRIEINAFGYTRSLTELNLPSSLTYVGSDALRTRSDITLVFSGSLSGWNADALNDHSEGRTTFNCIGNQDACRAQVGTFMSRATYTNTSWVDAYDQDGPYCYSGKSPVNGNCYSCGTKVSSCHWDEEKGKVVADGCSNSGYALGNGRCNYCGDGTSTCHWDDNTGKSVADGCSSSGYAFGNGRCNSCGDNVSTCHWDDGVVIDGCRDGYGMINGACGSCSSQNAASCHMEGNELVIDSCKSGYGMINGACRTCGSQNAASCHMEGNELVIDSCKSGVPVLNRECPQVRCETSGNSTYCYSGIDECAVYVLEGTGNNKKLAIKMSCKSASGGSSCNGTGAPKTDCTTEFYDDDGNIIAEYDDHSQPVTAYDYDDDGFALVYDDQCRVKERIDPNGNSMYDFGDTLLSENRRTRYTPAEAAEIVGNSQDNMIVMYFK